MDPKTNTTDLNSERNQAPPPYPGNTHCSNSPVAQAPPQSPYNSILGFDLQNASYQDQRNIAEAILASQNVAAAILQNGRNPITAICPNCRSNAETHITVIESEGITEGTSNFQIFRYVFGGMAIGMMALFIFVAIIVGSIHPLGYMLLVLALLGFGYYGITRLFLSMAPISNDIQHRCSVCHILLGVSHGVKGFEAPPRNRRAN